MLYSGYDSKVKIKDTIELLRLNEGILEEEESKKTIINLITKDLKFFIKLVCGIDIYPFQEIMIKTMFLRDNCLFICSRGVGKTFTCALFIITYAILFPGSKIGILGPNFRRTKEIFKAIEDFAASAKGIILKQCINEVSHKSDYHFMKIGKSEVYALPLGTGNKLRGFRFSVVCLDEAGFVPASIITNVIRPFLSTNIIDPQLRKKVENDETKLIKNGLLKEEDRTVFQDNKFIALSSATYTFDYLYSWYKAYEKNIYEKNGSYAIVKFSYKVAPEGLLNEKSTEAAKSTMSSNEFRKEYGAEFVNDAGGFFNVAALFECTVPDDMQPSIKLVGDKKLKYLLAIDPSSSKSETSDNFAMSVFELDEKNKKIYLVHNYAVAGGEISNHINYLSYLLQNFNIVFITVDSAGISFIDSCNTSTTFKDNNLFLDYIDVNFNDDEDYDKILRQARNKYNLEAKRIVYSQIFTNGWKYKANQYLQLCIERKNIWYAGKIIENKEPLLNTTINRFDNLKWTAKEDGDGQMRMFDFIEHQNELMDGVKSEIALIEQTSNNDGVYRLDLPRSLRTQNSATKVRRDLWTTNYMGNIAAKYYFDMQSRPMEDYIFIPTAIEY